MCVPKPVVKIFSYEGLCKNVHNDPNKCCHYPGETSHSFPTPIVKFRQFVCAESLQKKIIKINHTKCYLRMKIVSEQTS